MKIKSKFKYACINQRKHIFLNSLLVLQLVSGFLCIYYGFSLYMDNKENQAIANKMLTKNIYRIESLYNKEHNENNNTFEKQSLAAMEILVDREKNFLCQNEVGVLAKYFNGASDIARYGRIESVNGENYYDAGIITINKLFIDFYNIKVDKGRLLTDEELKLKFDNPSTLKVLVGYDYGKYFNVGDKISNLNDTIKEFEIVGILPKDSYINNFENGEKISLNKYMLTGYNLNKNAELLLNYSVMNSAYLLYDEDLSDDKIKELNDTLIQDFYSIYGDNIGLRNINDLNKYSNSIWESRLTFIMKMISIIMVFIFSTIIISTILRINKRKKEFAVHILSGGTLNDICEIIFVETYGLFIFSMILSSAIISFINIKLNIQRMLLVNFIILLIGVVISILPIIIKSQQVHEILKGE